MPQGIGIAVVRVFEIKILFYFNFQGGLLHLKTLIS